jgi:hypothetical protein
MIDRSDRAILLSGVVGAIVAFAAVAALWSIGALPFMDGIGDWLAGATLQR